MTSTPAPGFGNASRHAGPLSCLRICDLSGQLAGAGATRLLSAFGAQVIRVEDPVKLGLWDIVRQLGPPLHQDRSHEGGAGFNNHNVEKLGVTINLRTGEGKELLRALVRVSDAVTENFAAGVMGRLGFGYEQLRELKPDIVYVSNSGFGHTGPYRDFKSWGPIAQAVSGLTWSSGMPDREPAGWGYSYMDHTGGYLMAIALLSALWRRARTGEGQWVDISCSEAGITLNGPSLLDATVNRRPHRRGGQPDSNRDPYQGMTPHGIYPCAGDDMWIAIACRHDSDRQGLVAVLGADDDSLTAYTERRDRDELVAELRAAGVPCAPVLRPPERCAANPDNDAWNLWPVVRHTKHGDVPVDGLPVHLSRSDWRIERGGPLLGEHNTRVLTEVLGMSPTKVDGLRQRGVI
jgi:benzylsuccinate CoA-transferase BbsF subunit